MDQQHQPPGRPVRATQAAFLAVALLVGLLLQAEPASAAHPGDPGRIAFETTRDGNLEIYSMRPDGSLQTNLTNDTAEDTDPVWSPSGRSIAFVKASEGHRNIYRMNADGSGQMNLTPGAVTTGEANDGVNPTWSPDGSRIAYAAGHGDIWVMNADGGVKTNLTRTLPTVEVESQPAWSPTGSAIAYVRDADIWVMDPDGTNQRALTTTTGSGQDEKAPDWSPDGSQIVYGKAGDVWAMNADGTNQRRLVAGAVLPAFSPDGARITFSSSSHGAPNGPDIFVARADGTGITRLPTAVPGGDNDPTWQPDPGVAFHPLTPARILDSRPVGPQVGPYGTPWAAGQVRDVTVAGVGGVPASADAVVMNVTVTGTTADGYLTIWPAGEPMPLASSLNWAPGQTIPNAVTVKLGDGGRLSVANAAGSTDVVMDVVGYYSASVGDGYSPLTPARVLDSRPGGSQVGPYGTPWGPSQTRDVTVAGVGGVPADANAVVLNVTVTRTTGSSYLTVWPAGQPMPLASSLNWAPGTTIANAVTAKVGAGGRISVFNGAGDADVIVDVVGSFSPGRGELFHPVAPARILDSRPAGPQVGPYFTPWGPGVVRDVQVAGQGRVRPGAVAALLNVTVTRTTAPGYLTIWPAGEAAPLASSLNWEPGQTIPNAVTAKLGTGGRISVRNAPGHTDVIADVAGWYG